MASAPDVYKRQIINRENVQWMVENVPFEFDAIVVDELSSFKNLSLIHI